MQPSLDDLALFAAVVDAGGFSAAERRTGRPQATISRRIADLERALGTPLLDRSSRRIDLTEAGQRILGHAQTLRSLAEATRAEVEEVAGAVAGRLIVTAPVVLGQAIVAPILADFAARHPRINLQIEWTTRAVDPISDGVDVAILLGLSAPPDAVRTLLGQATGRLYAPPGFADSWPAQPEDLAGVRLATMRRSLQDRTITLMRGAEARRVEVDLRAVANDVRPVIDIARACGCLALIPDFAAPRDWTPVLPDWTGTPVEINALRARSRGTLPKVQALVKALQAGFRARAAP